MEIKSVVVSKHASRRWNNRVGPVMGQYQIQNYINGLIKEGKYQVKVSTIGKFILVDGEFLTAFQGDVKDGRVFIATFYGRVSLKPCLKDLIDFGMYIGNNSRKVCLEMPKNVIKSQKL